MTEITPCDVVACYTEENDSGFWLFFIEEIEGDTIKGRWFQENSQRSYSLEKRSEILVNNVVRIGTGVDMVYVLPKHFPINECYSLAPAIEKMLIREIASFYS